MPYITKEQRNAIFDECSKTVWVEWICCAGDLNFAFTRTIMDYIERKGMSYQVLNDIIGALEGCKLELYRRQGVIHEEKKIKENGDL